MSIKTVTEEYVSKINDTSNLDHAIELYKEGVKNIEIRLLYGRDDVESITAKHELLETLTLFLIHKLTNDRGPILVRRGSGQSLEI